jgi:hypothetical protein
MDLERWVGIKIAELVQYAPGICTPINVVAKEDNDPAARAGLCEVGADGREQTFGQIGPPMDIANGPYHAVRWRT